MTFSEVRNVSRFGVAAVAVVLATSALAEQPATTLTTLLDKQVIQDMLVDYYGRLGAGRSDFGAYYVADGVLDVNGVTAQGEKAIEDLYKKVAEGTPMAIRSKRSRNIESPGCSQSSSPGLARTRTTAMIRAR